MKKSLKKSPDRIIVMETGLIIALLLVNWTLQLSYMPMNVLDPDEISIADTFEVSYIHHIPEAPKKPEKRIDLPKAVETPFNPVSNLKLVEKLTQVPKMILKSGPKGPGLIKKTGLSLMKTAPTTIDSFVSVMPQFPGGQEALNDYFQENVNIPDEVRSWSDGFTVAVEFVVMYDGSIDKVKIKHSGLSGFGMEKRVKQAVEKMPEWIPGSNGGMPANVKLVVPIVIRLE
ncbi:hypothetical protein GYB22_07970 [bacterium]|nr:hypothetical protein [bacterium]